MNLIARQEKAAAILEKLIEHLEQEVQFTKESTAFDMGVQQERRSLLYKIRHWNKQG